jgi:hypothetical protein
MVDIELISAGSYKVLTAHPEGRTYRIVKTDGWEGPRGGKKYLWEAVEQVPSSWKRDWVDWVVEDYSAPAVSLAEARRNLADLFESIASEVAAE